MRPVDSYIAEPTDCPSLPILAQIRWPQNHEVTADGVRHFAYGYGDDNPLWCDPEYGRRTRWGEMIAPPNFLYTMVEQDAPKSTLEIEALLKGDPLAGLGS